MLSLLLFLFRPFLLLFRSIHPFFSKNFPALVQPRPVDQLPASYLFRVPNGRFDGFSFNYVLEDFHRRFGFHFAMSSTFFDRFAMGSQRVRRLDGPFHPVRRDYFLAWGYDPVPIVAAEPLINCRASGRFLSFAFRLCGLPYDEVLEGVMSPRAEASAFGRFVRVFVSW